VLAVSIFMRGLRWRALFPQPSRPTVKLITRANLIGYLFNTILPARAGEPARVIALRRAGWSLAQTTGTVVVERVYDVLSLLVLLFIAAPWLPHVSWLRTAAILAAALAAGLLVVIVLLSVYGERALRVLLKPLAQLPFVSVEQFDRGTRNLGTGLAGILSLRIALVAWAWTIASWVMMALSYWIGLRALDLHLSPLAGLLVVIAVGLSMILPSSPAAFGVFEAAAVVALKAYGVQDTKALSYALAIHAVNLALYLGAGLVALRFGSHPALTVSQTADTPSDEPGTAVRA
jgi:uncharacterized protein (TIRG00374 family)